MKRLFSLLLFGIAILIGVYLASGINYLIDASKHSVDFTANSTIEFTVDETREYYLMVNDSNSTSFPANNCDVGTTDQMETLLRCSSDDWFTFNTKDIMISVYNKENDEYRFFQSMGNTNITSNEYESIARITLDKGTYELTSRSSYDQDLAKLRLDDTGMVLGIVGVVFGGIGFVASLVGGIVLYAFSLKERRREDDPLTYYDSQMSKQDHNNDLFDDGDPFSKYDLD